MRTEDEINIPKETFEQIKYYAQCGYDVYTQRSPYVDYEKTFKLLEDAINYRKELEEKYHKKEEIICPM